MVALASLAVGYGVFGAGFATVAYWYFRVEEELPHLTCASLAIGVASLWPGYLVRIFRSRRG